MQNILAACCQTIHLFTAVPTYFSSLGSPAFSKLFMCKISPWRRLHKQHTEIRCYSPDLHNICIFLRVPHFMYLLLLPLGSLPSQLRASFAVCRLRTHRFPALPFQIALNRSLSSFGTPISSGPVGVLSLI